MYFQSAACIALSITLSLYLIYQTVRTQDLFYPPLVICMHMLVIFILPGIASLFTVSSNPFLINLTDYELLRVKTLSFLTLMAFVFSVVFEISRHIPQKITYSWTVEYISKYHHMTQFFLALSAVLTLCLLYPYWNEPDTEPYYHMSGFGIPHWIYVIFCWIPSFLLLSVKRYRALGILYAIFSLFFHAVIMNRGTQTGFMMICYLLIANETVKINFKYKLTAVCTAILSVLTWKALAMEGTGDLGSFFAQFIRQEVGRFDLLAASVYYSDNNYSISPVYLLRYLPFAGYIPYLNYLNEIFQSLPEKYFLGRQVSGQGGLTFSSYGEIYLFFGFIGGLVYAAAWGLAVGLAYGFMKKNKHLPLVVGCYAICFYIFKTIGLKDPLNILLFVIYISFFFKFTFLKSDHPSDKEVA